METKPIVTSYGNSEVFSSLHRNLLDSLPKESAEWRRSYGRQARSVYLDASFVPYDDDILPDETDKTLISRPYFHIYWTDCDLETYKVKVREELSGWSSALKSKNIPDWLIVVVNNEENKVKTKLLPRSSVYDKIKSDFCSKNPDRIVVLNDPLKQEPKTIDAWNGFVSKLRQHLLQAFTRHLQKYEDNMRALREKRNEVGWNFQQYFIVQEELAFMFEMLGLLEDGMIQYDELDALFTQFVVNHASGRIQLIVNQYNKTKQVPADVDPKIQEQLLLHHKIDLVEVPWLKSLIQPCKVWPGLSLHKPIMWEKRNLIKDNEATLLEFRGYLFSRQCALLFLLKRPGEIIRRAIDYLHETVQEMKTLDITIGQGGMDCWVFLSGLEVLQRCEKVRDGSQPRTQELNTAYLWDYVCRKLQHLGELCGLMPGSNTQPSSDQLTLVLDLISGMGPELSDDEEEEAEAGVSPRDKLRHALSSKGSFQQVYMEQSELAMGTFKHIGRFRSARMIGKNLAEFYMKLGEPQKAENFLMDAMTSYHLEGWKKLRDMTRLELATCQSQVANKQKYIKTACQVASSCLLDNRDRLLHINNVLDLANKVEESCLLFKASPLFKAEPTELSKKEITIDESFQITMTISNSALCDIPCDTVTLTFALCTPSDLLQRNNSNPLLDCVKNPLSRQTSSSSLDNKKVMNLSSNCTKDPVTISLRIHHEGNEASGITCVNSHEVLKRKDSASGMPPSNEELIGKDTMSQSISLTNVVLKPGENTVTLKCESLTAGYYKPGQIWIKIGKLEFIKDLPSRLRINVTSHEPFIEVSPDQLVCGVNHEVEVTLHAGSTPILSGSKVKVMPSDDLEVTLTDSPENVISLEQVERGGSHSWKMKLLKLPQVLAGKDIPEKVAFDCSWLPRPLMTTLNFQNAFYITHKLHTARDMKYIQMVVHGLCRTEFQLSDWKLEATNTQDLELVMLNKGDPKLYIQMVVHGLCRTEFQLSDWKLEATNTQDLELVMLNKGDPKLKVNVDQTASLVWQLKCNTAELKHLDLKFTTSYVPLPIPVGTPERQTDYEFSIDDFLTMFTVKTDVMPIHEDKTCKVGNLASLKIQVFQMPNIKPLPEQEYLYEVQGQTNWSCHGKSTGVFSITKGGFTTTVEVLPLIAGYIHLPKVKIFKYNGVIAEKDIWTKKAIFEKEEENMDSTDEESSEAESEQAIPPSHIEFEQGQVYYSSAAKQVRVYPEQSPGDIEISLMEA